MKNSKFLTNIELHHKLQTLIQSEREILTDILVHIREADRRKLYLEYSCSSLFNYLKKYFKYSNGSAQRRIDSARLLAEVPGILKDFETGDLNLSQVTFLQKSLRDCEKKMKTDHLLADPSSKIKARVSIELKNQIISKIKAKSFEDSQVLISKALDLEIKHSTKIIYQKDESVRLELSLSKQQWDKIKKMQDLLSHSVPSGSWDEILEYVADKVIESKTLIRFKKENRTKNIAEKINLEVKNSIDEVRFNTQEVAEKADTVEQVASRQPLSKALRKEILQKHPYCQHYSRLANKICGSTWQLEVHHKKPVWAGGENIKENLTTLCAQHNRFVYQKESGVKLR